MPTRSVFIERLEVENGQLVRVVSATPCSIKIARQLRNNPDLEEIGGEEIDVYKQYEDGKIMVRNLYFQQLAGYTVAYPSLKYNYIGVAKLEEWGEANRTCNMYCSEHWFNKEEITKKRPDLKYLIKKYKGKNITEFMLLVQIYKDHPEIESLVELNQIDIALSKKIWKFKKDKKIKLINFIKNNNNENMNLRIVEQAIKNNVTYEKQLLLSRFYILAKYKFNSEEEIKIVDYLTNKNIELSYYNDYLNMCDQCGKDWHQEYWMIPKDIEQRHNYLMEIIARKKEAEQKQLSVKVNNQLKYYFKFNEASQKINGYSIYIPTKMEDIIYQADFLHQCLITAKYYEKMAKKNCILVFIKKDNEPIATAELNKEDKVVQFYGNELDRSNCKPNEEITNIFNNWLIGFKQFKEAMA